MELDTKVVIPLRSPYDVSSSLHKREGWSRSRAMLLWLRHMLDAERDSRDMDRCIFRWSDFQRDWRKISAQISGDLHISWPKMTDASANYIDEFLSDDLVHNKTDDALLYGHLSVHQWVVETYEALNDLADGNNITSAMAKLDDIYMKLDAASSLLGPVMADIETRMDEERNRCHQLIAEVNHTQLNNADLVLKVDNKAKELEELRIAYVSSGHERDRIAFELDARIATSAEFEQNLIEQRAAFDDLERRVNDLQSSCNAMSAQVNEKASELDRLQSAHMALLDEREQLTLDRDAQDLRIRALSIINTEFQTAFDQGSVDISLDGVGVSQDDSMVQGHIFELQSVLEKSRDFSQRYDEMGFKYVILKDSIRHEMAEPGLLTVKNLMTSMRSRTIVSNKLFDHEYYLPQLRSFWGDVDEAFLKSPVAACKNYLRFGFKLGLNPNPLFDTHWYLKKYDDLRLSGMNPLWHFLAYGASEGRDPGPDFCTSYYLENNPDVALSKMNPLTHYLCYGMKEGRVTKPAEMVRSSP